MKNLKTHAVYLLIIAVVIALLLVQHCHSRKTAQLLSLQQSVLADSLLVTTNKLGQQTASINLISTEYRQFQQLVFAERDSLGRELQKLVNRRTISATLATQIVRIDTVLKTDSVYYATGDTCNPVYVLTDLAEHRIVSIRAARDSFKIQVREFEKLTFIQEYSKWRLFKKQTCLTRYTNSNPDVEITGLRTFTVKCDCSKKSWISFGAGNLLGMAQGFGLGYGYAKFKK